jgi:O-antigen ligase
MAYDGALDARPAEAASPWPIRLLLALFGAGVACDTVIGPLLGSRGEASLVASAALGAPLAVASGWQLVRALRVRRLSPTLAVLLAFTAWSALTIVWALSPDDVVTRSVTNVQLFGFVWLGWQVVRAEEDVRALVAGYVLGCLVIVQLAWQAYSAGDAAVDARYVAGAYDPNDMALYLVLGIPMAAYVGLTGSRASLAALLYVPIAIVGIGLTGSRTGLLAGSAAAAAVLVWIAARNRIAFVAALALVGVGIAFAAVTLSPDVLDRLFTVEAELRGGGIGDRARIWRAGMQVLSRNPAIGIGAGGFANAVATELHVAEIAHNTPLSLAAEVGAIGLVLFGGALASVAWGVRRSGLDQRALAWALILAWTVGSASLSWEFRKPTWFVLLVGAALAALPAPERARPEDR